jgi:transcriptional regulator with XRE-family HTH domain
MKNNREKFRSLRKAAGLNQEKLGEVLGISRQAVQRVETGYEGRSPTALQVRAAEIVVYNAQKGQLEELAEHLKDNR